VSNINFIFIRMNYCFC